MLYEIGSIVTIYSMEDVMQSSTDKYVGQCGKVIKIDLANEPWIYKVEFENDRVNSQWFSECELTNK